ncbi:MAG: tetratricopeptide repeat protein [Bacteroidota bacterium]
MSKTKAKTEIPAKKATNKAYAIKKSNAENKTMFQLVGIGIVLLLGILIYSNSFDCSFQFDDQEKIVGNTMIHDQWSMHSLWNYGSNRFIPYLSLALNYQFGKLDVWGYHFFNMLVHLVTSLLVGWLTLLLFSSPVMKNAPLANHRKIIALITALLFVSHPLSTQSVTYIVQRMASMVTLFYLLSVALYIKARLSDKSTYNYLFFFGSFMAASLALITKENAYTLPFAIVLVELFFFRTKKLVVNIMDTRTIIVFAGIALFLSFVIYKYSNVLFKTIPPDEHNGYRTITTATYLLTQFSVITKYIQLLFLPINQNFDYDFSLSNSFFELKTMLSFSFLLSLIILAIFLFKRNRIVSFGILWFFLTLSIESSIIPISDLIFEHRTYLPSYGFFLIISTVLYGFFLNRNHHIAIYILAFIIAINSYLTYQRNKDYKSEMTFLNDIILKSPNKPRAYNNRGTLLGTDNKIKEAIMDFSKAIELQPNYLKSYNNRGSLYAKENNIELALKDYSKAIEIDSNNATTYFDRGLLFQQKDQFDEAYKDYKKAIALNANYTEAYVNLGNLCRDANKAEEAIGYYDKAIGLKPDFAIAYSNRGMALGKLGQWEKDITDISKAIELNPKAANYYLNRANAYLSLSQWDNAFADYSKAIGLNPKFVRAYNNRAIAYYKHGDLQKSIDDYNQVITLDPNNKDAFANRDLAMAKLKGIGKK